MENIYKQKRTIWDYFIELYSPFIYVVPPFKKYIILDFDWVKLLIKFIEHVINIYESKIQIDTHYKKYILWLMIFIWYVP